MVKSIKFSATKEYLSLKTNLPKPIKTNIPEWFKKLNHTPTFKTIKGCMPFLDTLTTGYVLEMPLDLAIEFNIKDNEGKRQTSFHVSNEYKDPNLNVGSSKESHPIRQFKGSPIEKKNLFYDAYKIINPWKIKTPPGYSCLFVPPLNNADDRFSIIPGIVNTDTFENIINFPFIINSDKYPILNTILKKGTPYVQVIPFKYYVTRLYIKCF